MERVPVSKEALVSMVGSLVRKVVMVYEAPKPRVTPVNLGETLRRRPEFIKIIALKQDV